MLQVNLRAAESHEELSPYDRILPESVRDLNFLYNWTSWGAPQTKSISSKNWDTYNLRELSPVTNWFNFTQKN